jgi:predicted dehydrogenase
MTTPSARHRAVVVGLGFIGAGDQVSGDAIGGQQVANLDGTHAGALAGNPRVEVVAGSSRDAGRRERFTQRTGVKAYADWREMLASERPAIVSVATYTPQHAEVTIEAIRCGARVVYCEKPIAATLAEAETMLDASRKAGALLVINHNRRFNPNYRRLRDLIAAGGLGDLTSASLQWGGGRLGNIGTHFIDALVMLTSRRVESVSGTLDQAVKRDVRGEQFQDPGGWGVLKLSGGLMCTLDAPALGKTPPLLQINGTLGRATTAGDDVTIERWGVAAPERWPSVRREATSMDRAVSEIVAWLDHGTPLPYPAEDAKHVLETIVAIHASHARHAAWTDLPLAGADRERVIRSG